MLALVLHTGPCSANHNGVFVLVGVNQHPREGLVVAFVDEGAQRLRCTFVGRVADHRVVVLGHADVPSALAVVSEVDGSHRGPLLKFGPALQAHTQASTNSKGPARALCGCHVELIYLNERRRTTKLSAAKPNALSAKLDGSGTGLTVMLS
jgi:hypothetical protein